MHPEFEIVEGEYWRDILDQPQALKDTLDGLEESSALKGLARRLKMGEFQRVVLTGMGSSFHALHPTTLDLVDHGLTAFMVETSELIHYQSRLFDTRSLIIAVSQSGKSAEVVRMLEINQARSPVVAVTNNPDGLLAQQADVIVLTRAGQEFSVSCKTYVTALMALKWLGDMLCEKELSRTRQELAEASPIASDYLAKWKEHVQDLSDRLKDINHLFMVGRGASLAAVGTGGLIVKESDHFPAEGMSSAAFRHGPLEIVSEETFVLLFSGDPATRALNWRLLEDIRLRQGKAELTGDDAPLSALRLPAAPDGVRPVLEILPVEMITLSLAVLAGREAGRFESAMKVTTME